ncbi:hypothetical protein [Leptolyngbya ohadii]|uniref:hypothetical protein n=1 Tax=Leptolyngbya ohadii TaxID=1962290 RepID=UPI00117AA424|nr:hypothetical protein [Leptolyngbya ohadii]
MSASQWIRSFLDWLKSMLGRTPRTSATTVLGEWHSKRVSVFRIRNDSIPGCCEFWKVDHHHEEATFWICCINLAQLRADLAELGTNPGAFLRTHHRGMAHDLQSQLEAQNQYLASHYWICGISRPYAGIDPKGRHYRSFRNCHLTLLAGDFQGIADSYAGDRYIRRFAREVASRIANCEFREYRSAATWVAAIKTIDWVRWLEGMAQGKDGIDLHHRLQVRKPKKYRSV